MKVTLAKAQEIAEAALQAKIQAAPKLRDFAFGPAKLTDDYPPCWAFAVHSEQMWEAGYAPAALFVYIDKVDGHVWTVAEQNEYFYADEKKAQQQPIAA